MYSYKYSEKTGGIILGQEKIMTFKEPRPVYAPELNLFGFDKHWQYDNQDDVPYMWAEANRYFYKGKLVALLRGGNAYNAPAIHLTYTCSTWKKTKKGKTTVKTVCKPIEEGGGGFVDKYGNVFTLDKIEDGKLHQVDINAMIEENREILSQLEDFTAKKIIDVYERYKNKVDVFHVAFSGGKDSCVLLDIIKKTLPKNSFITVFGDTGMEFDDTYTVIDKTEEQCKEEGLQFHRAPSPIPPDKSWDLFAPPSRALRWCCSVHKSTPQILKLREITGKKDYTGLAFVGVRADESSTRLKYTYENDGKKVKGQYSHNSILEWNSAEIWLYIYTHNLAINKAYKKGHSRAGCICCPMGGGKPEYVEINNYRSHKSKYFDKIIKSNGRKNISNEDYVSNYGWIARKTGNFLANRPNHYSEEIIDKKLIIKSKEKNMSIIEWLKILTGDERNQIDVQETGSGFYLAYPKDNQKPNASLRKKIRLLARRAAYCKECRTCEVNCPNGCISFKDGDIKIDSCLHCGLCLFIPSGCLRYNSLKK